MNIAVNTPAIKPLSLLMNFVQGFLSIVDDGSLTVDVKESLPTLDDRPQSHVSRQTPTSPHHLTSLWTSAWLDARHSGKTVFGSLMDNRPLTVL